MNKSKSGGSTQYNLDAPAHCPILFIFVQFSRKFGQGWRPSPVSASKSKIPLVSKVQRLFLNEHVCMYYCPQRSWGKVMFLHESVILFTGGCLPQCMLRYHPPPPGAGTPPSPWNRHPPCAVHAGRYGQQAGGMHPTGMQSCSYDVDIQTQTCYTDTAFMRQ